MKQEKENIPRILYRYRQLNDITERMIKNGEIYFAKTNELADKSEKSFKFTTGA